MAFNASNNTSHENLLQNVSGPSTNGTTSPAWGYCDTPTMSEPSRPKKNVKWHLGQDAFDEQQSPPSGIDGVAEETSPDGEGITRDKGKGRAIGEQQDEEPSNEQIRNQLQHILSHPSHPPDDPPPQEQPQQHTRPALHREPQIKPKSVLKSGTSTPVVTVSPPPEPVDDVSGAQNKSTSAYRAKREADRLSHSLAEPDSQPPRRNTSWRSLLRARQPRSRNGSPPPKRPWSALFHDGDAALESGQVSPVAGDDYDHVERPKKYRLAGLSALQLYDKVSHLSPSSRRNSVDSDASTPSGLTPNSSFLHSPRQSISSLAGLVSASGAQLGSIGGGSAGKQLNDNVRANRPVLPRSHSDTTSDNVSRPSHIRRSSSSNLLQGLGGTLSKAITPHKKSNKKDRDNHVRIHVRQTQERQRYLRKLCRALMEYGAPTHRLEGYMGISSKILEIEAHWLYLPGCMIVSFDDSQTHTSDVKLVRVNEGVDLGKLRDTHDIYKQVVHDQIGVDEALIRLDAINKKPKKFNTWISIFAHGIASAAVSPFAFKGRLVDLPVAFLLGSFLGFLRLWVASKSELYASIFEVASVVATSALARTLGSINNGSLFCFSTLAQSSIALILPGYIVLCGALELQSRSLVAGSVRMVYAIIYSLFIGFGLTIGTAFAGWGNKNATSEATCRDPMHDYWYFFFVPVFAVSLMIINQAKYKQMPMMLFIACAGYFVSFVSSRYLPKNAPVSSALAAAAISILANIYSRIGDRLDRPFATLVDKIRTGVTGNQQTSPDEEDQPPGLEKPAQQRPSHQRGLSTTSSVSDVAMSDLSEHNQKPEDVDGSRRSGMDGEQKDRPDPRVNYSPAAAVMLPAIFVLVPSGLSVSGSLVSGLASANDLTHNTTSSTTIDPASGTAGLTNNTAFTVGLNVVQIAIGITVGLFIGTICVYPFGKGGKWGGTKKTRSGLFTF